MNDLKIGPVSSGGSADGTYVPQRGSRVGNLMTGHGQGFYYEQTVRGNIYTLAYTACTSGNIAAGNLVGATAAQSTQVMIWNPPGSGVNLVLLKFGLNITSGTTPVSGIWHGVGTPAPTVALSAAAGTAIGNHNAGVLGSGKAGYMTHLTGGATTGCGASRPIRLVGLTIQGAGAYASLAGTPFMDLIDGDIVLPPNTYYAPQWAATGTNMVWGCTITWEEVPV